MNPAASESPRCHAARLLDLISSGWQTQAIGVAAELGLADAIAAGAMKSSELAARLQLDSDALDRLLRALVSLDVCHLQPDGRYALAPMGALLRSESPGSLRDWATWWGRYLWPLWGELKHSIESGQSARLRATGGTGFAHIENAPEVADLFNSAMRELTALVADALVREVKFPTSGLVVDLGGGHGELLTVILQAHPALRGLLFELPHALEGARTRLNEAGVRARVEVVEGDFFEAVPYGGNVYLLKSVLHNWDDQRCVRLLECCRVAMTEDARLWVIERVRPERAGASDADRIIARNDLNMLIGLGGRERTQDRLTSLFTAARLQQLRTVPLPLGLYALEVRATT